MDDTVKYVTSKWLGRHSQVAKATVCKAESTSLGPRP